MQRFERYGAFSSKIPSRRRFPPTGTALLQHHINDLLCLDRGQPHGAIWTAFGEVLGIGENIYVQMCPRNGAKYVYTWIRIYPALQDHAWDQCNCPQSDFTSATRGGPKHAPKPGLVGVYFKKPQKPSENRLCGHVSCTDHSICVGFPKKNFKIFFYRQLASSLSSCLIIAPIFMSFNVMGGFLVLLNIWSQNRNNPKLCFFWLLVPEQFLFSAIRHCGALHGL